MTIEIPHFCIIFNFWLLLLLLHIFRMILDLPICRVDLSPAKAWDVFERTRFSGKTAAILNLNYEDDFSSNKRSLYFQVTAEQVGPWMIWPAQTRSLLWIAWVSTVHMFMQMFVQQMYTNFIWPLLDISQARSPYRAILKGPSDQIRFAWNLCQGIGLTEDIPRWIFNKIFKIIPVFLMGLWSSYLTRTEYLPIHLFLGRLVLTLACFEFALSCLQSWRETLWIL